MSSQEIELEIPGDDNFVIFRHIEGGHYTWSARGDGWYRADLVEVDSTYADKDACMNRCIELNGGIAKMIDNYYSRTIADMISGLMR